jgi:predicted O-methyltransferase YrrM
MIVLLISFKKQLARGSDPMQVSIMLDPQIQTTLDRLQQAAKGDIWKFARGVPAVLAGFLKGRSLQQSIQPYLSEAFIPVSPDSGDLLYNLAVARGAKHIVEFGTSYGISTLYLAAAARVTGGRVIGTEMEPAKHSMANAHLVEAGVSDLVDVRLGDALQTLAEEAVTIDFVLLDGWKDLYIPVLELLLPKLVPGAIIVADNIFTFKTAMRPYVARMQAANSGFHSVTVPIGAGMEFSIRD